MRELIEKLNYYTKLYDEGKSPISDKEWDNMYFELKRMEESSGIIYPDSPTQSIPYTTVSSLGKVEHNHWMGSLNKTKSIDELENFIGDNDYVIMAKMDGLTCTLKYVDGILMQAETRGNGTIGEDITHNAKVIKNIPQTINETGEWVIDGEIICTYKDFEGFSKEYKNPRNFAAGSIRLLDARECASRRLSFVAWDLIKSSRIFATLDEKLGELKTEGFTVVPYDYGYSTECLEDKIDFIKQLASYYSYPIDGLVIKYNDCAYYNSLGKTEHHPLGGISFKFYDEVYETTLRDIEWGLGRTSVLTPVAIFDPVEIDGSVISKASLHNLSVMRELSKGYEAEGDIVSVFKSNAIIPQIMAWNHPQQEAKRIELPKICPVCGGPISVVTSEQGVKNLYCANPQCEGKLINILDHYASKKGLDIKGLSENTLGKLISWGWVSNILDLYSLKKYEDEWKNKAGFGPKSVSNILSAIEKSKECTLAAFISAIGIPLIGSSIAKVLAQEFKTWEAFREAVKNEEYHFWELDGFGPEMDSAIKNFDYTEADAIEKVISIKSIELQLTTNKSLEGKSIVVTGKLRAYKNRDAIKQEIERRGGKVTNSVTKNTFCLINNDFTSQSAKNLSAQRLDIPIMSEEEFSQKFLLT